MTIVLSCFVYALLGFGAREFPAKTGETLEIYHLLKVVCEVQFYNILVISVEYDRHV